jgi:hypothetical protein
VDRDRDHAPDSLSAGDLTDLIAAHVVARRRDDERRRSGRSAEENAIGAYRHLWSYLVENGYATDNVASRFLTSEMPAVASHAASARCRRFFAASYGTPRRLEASTRLNPPTRVARINAASSCERLAASVSRSCEAPPATEAKNLDPERLLKEETVAPCAFPASRPTQFVRGITQQIRGDELVPALDVEATHLPSQSGEKTGPRLVSIENVAIAGREPSEAGMEARGNARCTFGVDLREIDEGEQQCVLSVVSDVLVEQQSPNVGEGELTHATTVLSAARNAIDGTAADRPEAARRSVSGSGPPV